MHALILALLLTGNPVQATNGDLTLWVDPINGSTASPCLNSARPCKDTQVALNSAPHLVRHNLVVNVADGDIYVNPNAAVQTGYNGFFWTDSALYVSGFIFDFSTLPSLTDPNTSAPRLVINCAQDSVLALTTPTSHVDSPRTGSGGGGPSEQVVKTAAGWTVNAYKGDFIKFQSDGHSFPIVSNTATAITFTGYPYAAHSGAFTIWKPGTKFHEVVDPVTTVSDVDYGIAVRTSVGSASISNYTGPLIVINNCEVDAPSGGGFGAFDTESASVLFNNVKMTGPATSIVGYGGSVFEINNSYLSSAGTSMVVVDEQSTVSIHSSAFVSDYVSNFDGVVSAFNHSVVTVQGADIQSPRIVANANGASQVAFSYCVAQGKTAAPQTASAAYSGAYLTFSDINFTDYSSVFTQQYGSHGLYIMSTTTTTGVTNMVNIDGTLFTRSALEALTLHATSDALGTTCGGI